MEQPLSDTERDVLTLASIANPLPLDVVKAVIGIDDASTGDIVDRLGASGRHLVLIGDGRLQVVDATPFAATRPASPAR